MKVDREAWGLLLVRVMVGWVFLTEGLQKFLFPNALGAGRFERIGIPMAPFMAPFVGTIEVACGALLIAGLFAVWAALPLLMVIGVAIVSTKLPMLVRQGFWATMHEGRTDFCMLLGLGAILLLGSGRFSMDERGKSA